MKKIVTTIQQAMILMMASYIGSVIGSCPAHASTVGQTAWKLADDILSINGASNKIIYQTDVPYTISAPGEYVVGGTLTPNGASPIITVNAINVTIDLKENVLIGAGATNGITFLSGSGGEVTNGTISNFTNGVVYNSGATFGDVNNVSFVGCTQGVSATNMDALDISYSVFRSGTTAVSLSSVTTHAVIDNCIFEAMNNGVVVQNSSDIVVSNCVHNSALGAPGSAISFNAVSNSFIVNHIVTAFLGTIYNLQASSFNLILDSHAVGASVYLTVSGASSNNIMRNCTIQNSTATSIQIAAAATNTRLIGCIIKDPSAVAISDLGTNSDFFNCYINAASGAGITSPTYPVANDANVIANTTNWWQNLAVNA